MKKIFSNKIIIAIAVITASTVLTLSFFILVNKVLKKSSNDIVIKTKTTKEILSGFNISALSDKSYAKYPDAAALLQYKIDSEKLGINIAVKNSILYSDKNNSNSNDTVKVQEQTADYLTKNGLKQSEITIYNNTKIAYKTYSNDKTVCQLISNNDSQNRFHQFFCIDMNEVSKQYNSVKKLLAINNSPKINDYALITLINNSKDNINYSILNSNSKTRHESHLFASVDDNWEYLGDLLGGGKKYATEKDSITPELQSKIENTKYKGFLKESFAKN